MRCSFPALIVGFLCLWCGSPTRTQAQTLPQTEVVTFALDPTSSANIEVELVTPFGTDTDTDVVGLRGSALALVTESFGRVSHLRTLEADIETAEPISLTFLVGVITARAEAAAGAFDLTVRQPGPVAPVGPAGGFVQRDTEVYFEGDLTASAPPLLASTVATFAGANVVDLTGSVSSNGVGGLFIQGNVGFTRQETLQPGITAELELDGTFSATATSSIPVGDTSNDGFINGFDAALVLRDAVGLEPLAVPKAVGDLNGDGVVTGFDASLILRYAVGLITCFPVEPLCTLP